LPKVFVRSEFVTTLKDAGIACDNYKPLAAGMTFPFLSFTFAREIDRSKLC
jgi:hypothetical protein